MPKFLRSGRKVWVAFLMVLACDGTLNLAAPSVDKSIAEDRGTSVASGISVHANVFSMEPGGTWAAAAAGERTVVLTRPGISSNVPVYEMVASGFIFAVWLAPGGEHLYVAERRSGSSRNVITWIQMNGETTVAMTVTDRADEHFGLWNGFGVTFVGSPSGRIAFSIARDSLYTFDPLTEQTTFRGGGCTKPVTFSPNEDRVLCATNSAAGSYRTIALTALPQPSVSYSLFDQLSPAMLHIEWTSESVFALHWTFSSLEVLGPGEEKTVVPAAQDGAAIFSSRAAMWPSRRRVAFWRSFCAIEDLFTCHRRQYLLYRREFPAGAEERIAVTSEQPSMPIFAADGFSIFYVSGGTLYRVD